MGWALLPKCNGRDWCDPTAHIPPLSHLESSGPVLEWALAYYSILSPWCRDHVERALPFSRFSLCFLSSLVLSFTCTLRPLLPPVASLPVARRRSTNRHCHCHCLSHSQTGRYDVINYCKNYELPELEKSLLLDVLLVDWLLLVFTASVGLSLWCSQPRNFLGTSCKALCKKDSSCCMDGRSMIINVQCSMLLM